MYELEGETRIHGALAALHEWENREKAKRSSQLDKGAEYYARGRRDAGERPQ